MKSKQEYTSELAAAIEKVKLQIEAIDKLIPVMKNLDGKDIRQMKRIKTKLAETLPDCLVTFGEKYSWYEIYVGKRPSINSAFETLLSINCGYIGEVNTFDYKLITGTKERSTRGTLGNNYYFGTDTNYTDCRDELIKFEKQLTAIDKDYKRYVELHEEVKNFNISFLSIDIRR